MRRENLWWFGSAAVLMLLLPYLAVTFVKGDAGMAACFVLFYAVYPVYSVAAGVSAGRDMRHLWSLPVVSAALFLAGTWIFFSIGESAFLWYAAVYLGLGVGAMLLSAGICRRKGRISPGR